jgi:hypothetical protein
VGAGDSRQRSDLLAGLPLISKTKRECPVGTPSFVLSGGIAARGKGLPSVSRLRAGRVPPAPAACGPLTLPTLCGGGAAARPATPAACPGNVAAGRRLRRLRPSQPPAVARGHPVRPQGQAPAGPLRGPCPRPAPRRLRRWCSGAARPPHCGGCGAVRPSGPVGGASASLASPATPTAQAVPRGSAYALAARRSGPAGLALGHQWPAPSRPAGARPPAGGWLSPGLRRSFGSRRCGGPQFVPPRALAAQAPPSPRFARGGAQGYAACGRECRPFPRPARPRQAPRRAASRPQAGALPAGAPASEGKTWRVSRPLAGSRPSLILVKRWCFYVCCCLSYLCFWPGLVAGLPVWRCVWLVAVPACSVALALCSGGGFCLSAGGGICAGLFLACWCAGRSAGGGAVQIKSPHRVTSPVRDF